MDISNLKPGDIVICINNIGLPLSPCKKYKVINSGRAEKFDYITVYNDNGNSSNYLASRFTTLEDWREKKLNNILE
jgi:hypothetical protein